MKSVTTLCGTYQFCGHFSQPEHLLNTGDNVTVQCHAPSVIIRTVAAEEISPSVTQAELAVDSDIQPVNLVDPPTALEADAFPEDIHQPKLAVEEQSAYSEDDSSKFGGRSSSELIDRVMARDGGEILHTDIKCEEDCRSDLAGTYVSEVRKAGLSSMGIWHVAGSVAVAFEAQQVQLHAIHL